MEIFKTNYIGMVDKLVNQAKELEREAKLSNEEWVAEQYYEIGEEPIDHYEETINNIEQSNQNLL